VYRPHRVVCFIGHVRYLQETLKEADEGAAKDAGEDAEKGPGTKERKHRRTPTLEDVKDTPMAMVEWFWDHIQGMCNAVYLGFLGLVGQASVLGGPSECQTGEGRLINLSFGIFILSFITALTGVVAGNAVNMQYVGLESIADARAQGVTVCADPIVTRELAAKYPSLKVYPTTAEDGEAGGYDALRAAGKCGANVLTANRWSAFINRLHYHTLTAYSL
jgi:hypothetical protein